MDATIQSLKDAIYGQESSHGRADTSKENYAGARGPMQVTRSTFDSLKDKGIIPRNYDHANPEHGKAAGFALIDHLAGKFGNDPRKVAAAYYAGEKAVRADGTIADFRDLKNPKAPTTLQYVSQVLGRMGASETVDDAMPASTKRSNVLSAWTEGFGPRPDKIGSLKAAVATPSVADTALPQGPGTAFAAVEAEQAATVKENQRALDTSFLDASRAAFMHDGFLGNALKRVAREDFGEPVKGYAMDPKEFDGLTEDEQSALSYATNDKHRDTIKFEIAQRRADRETAAVNGPWVEVAASIFGQLPEGYVTGAAGALGAAKSAAMLGVRSRAGLLGVAAAENVGGNVALTAAQSVIDPYTGIEDGAMAVGMGLIGTSLHLPGIGRAADQAEVQHQADRIMKEAAKTAARYEDKARANLGADASRDQMQAEITRLQSNDAQAKIEAAKVPVDETRRLLPETREEPETPELPVQAPAAKAPVAPKRYESERLAWDKFGEEMDNRQAEALKTKYASDIAGIEGVNYRWLEKQSEGVHVLPALAANQRLAPAVEAIQALAKQMLPGTRIAVGIDKPGGMNPAHDGIVYTGKKAHIIGLRENMSTTDAVTTGIHEVAHAVVHEKARFIPSGLMDRIVKDFEANLDRIKSGAEGSRFGRLHEGSPSLGVMPGAKLPNTEYTSSFDEWLAEAGTRWAQRQARAGEAADLALPPRAVELLKALYEKVKAIYDWARGKGYLPDDTNTDEFFTRVLKGNLDRADLDAPTQFLDEGLMLPSLSQPITGAAPDVAAKYGFDIMPQDTPQARAEFKAIKHLYERADAWAALNPKDETKLSRLMNTAVFQNGQSIHSTMLRSDNPVVRMIASELMESASGAGGRRTTAAMAKHLHEQAFVGNAINQFQGAYHVWLKGQGGGMLDYMPGGQQWQQFNRLVAEEIEARRSSNATSADPAVKEAASHMEASYERMRVAQQSAKTVGWGALPTTSVGYMPHKMSGEKIRQLTPAQQGALHNALVEQFVQIEGFDISFSANLAAKYIDRIKRRALGGTDAPANVHQTGAADVVQEALQQMGMSKPEIEAAMEKYMRGGAAHTKQRLKLNLNQSFDDGAGGTFRLLDLFETDQLSLLRAQAGRVSGEVALAGHGVMGKPGLSILRESMKFGEANGMAQGKELEAFDQMAAEFLGDPFGTASSAKWLNRAMQATSLARLGGMGFTQAAESINAIAHVGAQRALAMVGGLNRLRREAAALAAGETVENPILQSLEKMSGVSFGTANRKMVFPLDNSTLQYQNYGKDTVTMADRVLRGATHLQGKLSLWQAIHGAQQRGAAEQIVSKAAEYIRAGKNDVALRDMGISDELAAKLKTGLEAAATFDGRGKLVDFDITKFEDVAAANEFVQAVHRGVGQIIQETFIGERGKWVHDATARIFTQFRTFSITSVEKQWGRQVNNHGTAKALGILMGSMSVAAPIYIARVYASSVGRADQQEYLESRLTPYLIARATMNYVAASGLAGDFLDATTAITGAPVGGSRSAASKSFIGNVIAPSAGLVDDAWKSLQNTKEGTDPHDFMKTLPFSNHPLLIPAINALDR